jgi:hypothetical protein
VPDRHRGRPQPPGCRQCQARRPHPACCRRQAGHHRGPGQGLAPRRRGGADPRRLDHDQAGRPGLMPGRRRARSGPGHHRRAVRCWRAWWHLPGGRRRPRRPGRRLGRWRRGYRRAGPRARRHGLVRDLLRSARERPGSRCRRCQVCRPCAGDGADGLQRGQGVAGGGAADPDGVGDDGGGGGLVAGVGGQRGVSGA